MFLSVKIELNHFNFDGFPRHIDRISMDLSILLFKGSHLERTYDSQSVEMLRACGLDYV